MAGDVGLVYAADDGLPVDEEATADETSPDSAEETVSTGSDAGLAAGSAAEVGSGGLAEGEDSALDDLAELTDELIDTAAALAVQMNNTHPPEEPVSLVSDDPAAIVPPSATLEDETLIG